MSNVTPANIPMPKAKTYQARAFDLRTRLFAARVSVTELAKRLGVTRQYLSLVLNGGHESKSLLQEIEQFLDDEPAAMAA